MKLHQFSGVLDFDPTTGKRLKDTASKLGSPYNHATEAFASEADFDKEIATLKATHKGVDEADKPALITDLKSQIKAARVALAAEIEKEK